MEDNYYQPPLKRTHRAAIDLDGTLCYKTWTPKQTRSVIGLPITENVKKLQELVDAGYEIWIHTARHWSDREMIAGWLEYNHIPYDNILCGKPLADVYVDDRAVSAFDDRWSLK